MATRDLFLTFSLLHLHTLSHCRRCKEKSELSPLLLMCLFEGWCWIFHQKMSFPLPFAMLFFAGSILNV